MIKKLSEWRSSKRQMSRRIKLPKNRDRNKENRGKKRLMSMMNKSKILMNQLSLRSKKVLQIHKELTSQQKKVSRLLLVRLNLRKNKKIRIQRMTKKMVKRLKEHLMKRLTINTCLIQVVLKWRSSRLNTIKMMIIRTSMKAKLTSMLITLTQSKVVRSSCLELPKLIVNVNKKKRKSLLRH